MTTVDEHGVPIFGLTRKADLNPDPDNDFKHVEAFEFSEPVEDKYQLEAEAFVARRKWPDDIPWHVGIRWVNDHQIILEWTNDDEERRITPKWVYNDSDSKVPSVLWQMYEPNEMLVLDVAAPGFGHQTFKVTRKDDTGLYGICTESTCWVPDDWA